MSLSRVEDLATALPLLIQEAFVDDESAPASTDAAEQPPGDVFLLVHGYGGSSYTWHNWLPDLARRGRVLQVDLKGFGRAPKPDDGRYAPTDLAEILFELIREQDLERITLIGHSLGGGVSLLTALRLIDEGETRLARLVLVAAPAYRQKLPPFVALSKAPGLSRTLAHLVGIERVVTHVLRSIVFDPATITREQIRAYSLGLAAEGGLRAAMDVGRTIVPDDIEGFARRYPEIDVPTLLLWGDHDRVIPLRIAHRLAEDLPRARLSVIESCGHIPPEERPAESYATLAAFLDETPTAS